MRRVLLVGVVVVGAMACSAKSDDVRDTAPCGLAVELLAEADPDAGEDDAAASLSDEFGGMDEIEVAEACSAMVFDLCDGPTSETFDQPLQGCSGRE